MAVQALVVPMLVGALASALGSLIGRAIIALGISFITYKGVSVGLDVVKNMVISSVSTLPSQMVGLIGYLWIDKGLTLIFSAFVAAMSLRLVGGSLKRAVLK